MATEKSNDPLVLEKGRHNATTMKAHLAKRTPVQLPNGETVHIQASGIIFNGQVITDAAKLPTDEEIAAHHEEVLQTRRSR